MDTSLDYNKLHAGQQLGIADEKQEALAGNPNASQADQVSQLFLDLKTDDLVFLDDEFIVSRCNEEAFKLISSWPEWPVPVVVLIAPEGSGKSHLASIWADKSEAKWVHGSSLSELDLNLKPRTNILLEDVDQSYIDQTGFFHLINAIRASRGSLLVTAKSGPENWGLTLPDLISRLRAALRVESGAPDDILLTQVIVKLFADRQIVISTKVVRYLVNRIERSLSSANQMVDLIDKHAWSQKREITVPLVSSLLNT